jgi:hypothetical protein
MYCTAYKPHQLWRGRQMLAGGSLERHPAIPLGDCRTSLRPVKDLSREFGVAGESRFIASP